MKIAFAHNVQNRHKTLRETIEIERKYFPKSLIYVAYNEKEFNLNYFNDLDNIKFIYYNGDGHKIGCVNGCITSINEALKDDNEIIVFSHDDVKINFKYFNVFQENIKKIKNSEINIICRKPHSYGDNYYMMEGFFIDKITAKNIFLNQNLYIIDDELPKDVRNSPSPEVWLYYLMMDKNISVKSIEYKHSINNYNEILGKNLGFYHKNAGKRGWND